MHDHLTLYKLIILYMLERVDFPLTRNQIVDFILEKEYTNFLNLQQAIAELIDAGFITAHPLRNRTQLHITKEGRESLRFFQNQLTDGIRADVDNYLRENELDLRNEASILSNYYKATTGEYEARLIAKEKNISLVDITLSVPSEETAAAICENWQHRNQEIYQYLVSRLF